MSQIPVLYERINSELLLSDSNKLVINKSLFPDPDIENLNDNSVDDSKSQSNDHILGLKENVRSIHSSQE